jgi:hypothetical protein
LELFKTVSAVLSGPLGFVMGFYFRDGEELVFTVTNDGSECDHITPSEFWAMRSPLFYSHKAIAPALTTLAPAIALKLQTHRAIAPLKQNLGQGDRLSICEKHGLLVRSDHLSSTHTLNLKR